MFAFYLHDLSPYAIQLSDSLAVRWYSLSYLTGFCAGYVIMLQLARRGLTEIRPQQVRPFITSVALFGVILGARAGEVLLYRLDEFREAPLEAFKLWKGGMSSHGCIAGVFLFSLWYAWRHRLSWLGLLDTVACAGSLGAFFPRVANFINGELFGRVTQVPWAVKFPTELLHEDFVLQGGQPVVLPSGVTSGPEIIALFENNGGGRAQLDSILHPRHPSQIYEAFGEGLLICVVLIIVRIRFPRLPHGTLAGMYLLLYAAVRITLESYRQPESGSHPFLGMTDGQFYSTFMIVIGMAFVIRALIFSHDEKRAFA